MSLDHRHAIALTLALAPSLEGCKSCKSDNGLVVDDPIVVEDYTNDWGAWLSMDVTKDGKPALAYYDRTMGGLGYAEATISGESVDWSHEEVDGFISDEGMDVGNRGMYASMKIDDAGTAWIAYYDAGAKTLRYATKAAGGSWENGLADTGSGASPEAGKFASLALDGSGNPVIAHYDAGAGQLRVAHWSGSSFSGEVVDVGEDYVPSDTADEAADADVGQYAKLLIDGGTEYIAYYDAANGALKLAVGTSGSYAIEVVDDTADVGAWPDMVMDGGRLNIAYQDVENQDLKYAVGSPGNWTISVIDDGEWVGADAAIYMNGSFPAMFYFDGRNNDMKWASLTGSTWTTDTVAGSDGALGYHNETVEIDGTRYAACYDYTNRTVWFTSL